MRNALRKRQALGWHTPAGDFSGQQEARTHEERFHAARVTGLGHARCKPYSQAWHPDYGLLTEKDDQLILRLNDEIDREDFCKDVLEAPRKLLFPVGIGANLFPVPKSTSFSGSLTTCHWKGTLAPTLFRSGLPVFPLPHLAAEPLELKHQNVWRSITAIWRHAPLEQGAAAAQGSRKGNGLTSEKSSPNLPGRINRRAHGMARNSQALPPGPSGPGELMASALWIGAGLDSLGDGSRGAALSCSFSVTVTLHAALER